MKIKKIDISKFYYRLKQIDYDGEEAYSYVVDLSNTDKKANSIKGNIISVYPNPASENSDVYIVLESDFDQSIQIQMNNVLGKRIFEEAFYISKGTNVYTLHSHHLNEGTYIISIMFEDGVENKKIIIKGIE